MVAINLFRHLVPPGPFPMASSGYGAWDGVYYQGVAQFGYRSPGDSAFFPLYPLAIRAVHGITRLSYLHSGELISDVSAIVALVLLHRLVARRDGRTLADHSVLLLVAFPFAFFLNVVYTEALDLMLILLFFVLLESGRWYWAMLAGAAAAATHDLGVLLVLPALWYWWRHGRSPLRLLSIAMIGASLAAYAGFLYWRFHNPLQFVNSHGFWGREVVVPVWSVVQSLAAVDLHASSLTDWNVSLAALLNGTVTLVVVALTLWALVRRVLPGEQAVYLSTSLLASIVTGTTKGAPPVWWTASYGRSMLVLFPAFIVLARLLRRPALVLAVAMSLLAVRVLITGLFSDGFWVV